MTDGHSNVQADRTSVEARSARDQGITMYAVATGEGPDMAEINAIASPDPSYVIRIRNAGELQNGAHILLDKLCQ